MLTENITLAFSSLAANKLRTFLTMLGIIIGIASVIAIMTVGNSQTEENARQMSMFGVNNVECYIWMKDDFVYEPGMDSSVMNPEFTKEMLEQMAQTYEDSIEGIAVQTWSGGGKAGLENEDISKVYANCDIQGVNNGFFTVNRSQVSLIDGKLFDSRDPENDYSAIVSDLFVNNLFGGDVQRALGSKFNVETNGESVRTYTIIGVYAYQSFGEFDASSQKDISTTVYIPYRNALSQSSDPSSNRINSFTIGCRTGVDVIAFTEELTAYLNSLLPPDTNYQIYCYNNAEWIEDVNKNMRAQTRSITLIGAIALLVGGIGVMNIMTVTITERTREIGTRKALGAPNGAIRLQFITEAVIICLMGGILGMLLGVGAGFLVCRFVQHIPVVMSASSVLFSFATSMAIGVFFGYYPADKAARMDPIEALRYE